MAYYTADRALEYPVPEVLKFFGHDVSRSRKTGSTIKFFSPFHSESDPSFSWIVSTNHWHDFSTGQGGGILDLVSILAGVPRERIDRDNRDEMDAMRFLVTRIMGQEMCAPSGASLSPRPDSSAYLSSGKEFVCRSVPREERGIVVSEVYATFTDRNLVDYSLSRCVPRDILERYCYQVTYHFRNYPSMGSFTSIGFPNVTQGYNFRSHLPDSKRCSSGGITLLNSSGVYSMEPTSDTVQVFEGFFDFLSSIQYNRLQAQVGRISGRTAAEIAWKVDKMLRLEPVTDVVVLNSAGNVGHSFGYVGSHRFVFSLLDRDKAGFEALQKLRENCPASAVIDQSRIFEGYDDFNEMLKAKCGVVQECCGQRMK